MMLLKRLIAPRTSVAPALCGARFSLRVSASRKLKRALHPKRIIAFSVFAALAVTLPDSLRAQWVQTNGPYGGEVSAFAKLGEYVFAGTLGGGVFRSSDSGVTWQAVNNGLTVADARTVYSLTAMGTNVIAGTRDRIFRSTDSGSSWNAVDTGGPGTWYIQCFASSGPSLYAGVGNGGGIYYSRDSGETWLPTYFTSDNGKTWLSTSWGYGAPFVFADSILIGGVGGRLIVQADPQRFIRIDSGFESVGAVALAVSDSQVFVSTYPSGISGPTVYCSTDWGATWSRADSGLPANEYVYALTILGSRIIAATEWDGFFASDDSGLEWKSLDNGLALPYGGLSSFEIAGNTILYGSDGVFRSTDSGESWTKSNEGLSATYAQTFLTVDSNLFVGTGTDLYRTTDFGTNWVDCTPPINSPDIPYHGIAALGQVGPNLFAGSGGGIFLSTDEGVSWSFDGLQAQTTAFIVLGNNLIAGTSGGAFRSTDSGASWDKCSDLLSSPILCLQSSGSTLYAATDGYIGPDLIYRSTDSGATWKVAGWPLLAIGDPNYDFVISLASIGSDLFAGTYTHGVYRSSNAGATWSRSNSGLTDLGISALLADATNLFVGTDSAGVFLSTDSGTNWISVSDGMLRLSITSLTISCSYLFAGTGSRTFPFGGTGGEGVCWQRPLAEMIAPRAAAAAEAPVSKLDLRTYPNPFSQSTTISITPEASGYAEVSIVNLLGVEVARIFSGVLAAGEHTFTWDASGTHAPQGIYECLIRMNGRMETLPVMLMR